MLYVCMYENMANKLYILATLQTGNEKCKLWQLWLTASLMQRQVAEGIRA